MKKTSCFYFFAVTVFFSFFVFGCATTGDLQRLLDNKTAAAVGELNERMAAIESRPAPRDLSIPVSNLQKEVAMLGSRLDKKEIRLGQVEDEVAELRRNADILVGTVADHETQLGAIKTRVSAVEAQVKKVGVKVNSAHKTAGAGIELAGGQRYFIVDFSTTEKRVEGQIETLHKQLKKEGLATVKIIGFDDDTVPKGLKDPAEIAAKKKEIAETRAAKVADGMEPPIITSATEVIGRGATGQFGDKKLNRCVLVVVEKAAPAPTTPATPATPAPAPTGGGGLPPAPATPSVPAVPPATITPPVGPSPTAPPAPPLPPSVPQPVPLTPVPAAPATPPAGTPSNP